MRLCWIALVAVACHGDDELAAAKPIDREAATSFAKEFAAAAMPCDEAKLGELFDQDAFAKRATAALPPALSATARITLDVRHTSVKVLCAWQKRAETYHLLHVQMREGSPHPVMRRLLKVERSGVVGVSYDELALARGPDGKPRVLDVYSFAEGQWLSEALSQEMVALHESGGVLDRVGAANDLQHALELGRAGDYQGALAAIDALPPKVRSSRLIQTVRVRYTHAISDKAYEDALDELARSYPDDPSISMLQVDNAILHHDYDAALRYIDAVDRVVGGDPFQDAVRAQVYRLRKRAGDLELARDRAEAAITAEPTLAKGWWALLDIDVQARRYDDAVRAMARLEQHFHATFDEAKLRPLPGYADFLDSPDYRAWKASK